LGFERVPLRVLLDTSVVQNIVTFGEYIFENFLSEKCIAKLESLSPAMQSDIHALRNILGPVTKTPVVPIISVLSLHELSLASELKRKALLDYGFELLDYSVRVGEAEFNMLAQNKTLFADFLPHRIDRLLIGESKRAKCQAFITMDYRSILRFAERINREDHIMVLSPSEWWNILEPWFALWV